MPIQPDTDPSSVADWIGEFDNWQTFSPVQYRPHLLAITIELKLIWWDTFFSAG